MRVIALDENADHVTIDSFFSKFSEFSQNKELAEQTSRRIKVLLRHHEPETIGIITDKAENGFSFTVSGDCRTYTVIFEIKDDTFILKELY